MERKVFGDIWYKIKNPLEGLYYLVLGVEGWKLSASINHFRTNDDVSAEILTEMDGNIEISHRDGRMCVKLFIPFFIYEKKYVSCSLQDYSNMMVSIARDWKTIYGELYPVLDMN